MTSLSHSQESSPWDIMFTPFFLSSNVKNPKTKCLSIYQRHSSVWFLIISVITCHFQSCFHSPCKSCSLPAVTNPPYPQVHGLLFLAYHCLPFTTINCITFTRYQNSSFYIKFCLLKYWICCHFYFKHSVLCSVWCQCL